MPGKGRFSALLDKVKSKRGKKRPADADAYTAAILRKKGYKQGKGRHWVKAAEDRIILSLGDHGLEKILRATGHGRSLSVARSRRTRDFKLAAAEGAILAVEDARLKPAIDLLGRNVPLDLLEFTAASIKAGSDVAGALRDARDAGWKITPTGWTNDGERSATFAEDVDLATKKTRTFGMRRVEIAREGVWPVGKTADDRDVYVDFDADLLKAMVASDHDLHDRVAPMVTLGHLDDAKASKQAGWGTRQMPNGGVFAPLEAGVNEDGSLSVYADVSGIPAALAQTIEHGNVGALSLEADLNYTDESTGKIYPIVFKRAAFLGGTKPIIDTMERLAALYEEDADLKWVADDRPRTVYGVGKIGITFTDKDDGRLRIAAAEGKVSITTVAGSDRVREDFDVDPKELAKLVTGAVADAIKPINDKVDGLASGMKTQIKEVIDEMVADPENGDAGEPAAAAAGEGVAKDGKPDPFAAVRADLQKTHAAALDAVSRVTAAEISARHEADSIFVNTLVEKGVVMPFEKDTLLAKFAEGDARGKTIKMGDGAAAKMGTPGDVEREFWRNRMKTGVRSVDMAAKGLKLAEGQTIEGLEEKALARHNITPDMIQAAIADSRSENPKITIAPNLLEFLGI